MQDCSDVMQLLLKTQTDMADLADDDPQVIKFPLPYFFRYETEFFSFLNNPKNLDPSYKMDLDLLDCLGRVKLVLYQIS